MIATAAPNLWELETEIVSDRIMLSSLPPETTNECFRREGKLSAPLPIPARPLLPYRYGNSPSPHAAKSRLRARLKIGRDGTKVLPVLLSLANLESISSREL